MSDRRIGFHELNDLLSTQIDALARSLLGDPNRKLSRNGELRYGRKGSLAINTAGPKRGRWKDFEAGEGGGPLDLIMHAKGCDLPAAAGEARRWLGIGDEPAATRQRTAWPLKPRIPETPAAEPEADEDTAATGRAMALFAECEPIAGSHAAAYLAARGLAIPDGAPLRAHLNLRHRTGRYLPGLVARVDGSRGPTGIHRTFLDCQSPARADVDPAKMMLGPTAGGAVRLTEAGASLAVAEGIETALSVWTATGKPTWAALSTSGLIRLDLPALPVAAEVTIAADRDPNGAGLAAAETAAARWRAEGRRVRIALPPASEDATRGRDFNDLLREDGPEAVRAAVEGAPWLEPAAVLAAGPALPRTVIRGVPPTFAGSPMEASEVSAILVRETRAWLDEALATGATRKDVAAAETAAVAQALADNPELDPAFNYAIVLTDRKAPLTRQYRRLVVTARREARRAALARHGRKTLPQAPRLQIAAGAGSGKTEAIVRAIGAALLERPFVIHFYVPTHALADGVADRLRQAGVAASVLRGRSAKNPAGGAMCMKPRLAEKVGRLGLNVNQAICKVGPVECSHFGQCAYMKQVRPMPAGGVVVMPHEYLTLPKPDGLPSADAVVVDESPLGSLLYHRSLDPAVLGDLSHWTGGPAELADFLGTCVRVREALLSGEPIKPALAASGVTREAIQEAARFARHASDEAHGVTPRMDEAGGLRALEAHRSSPRRTIARLLSRLAAELKLEREQVHGVEVREVTATIEETGERARQNRIVVHGRKHPQIDKGAAVLAIDADAVEEHGAIIWGPYVRHLALPVERNAVVTQVADQRFSKFGLVGSDSASDRDAKTAANRLEKVRRFIRDQVALCGRSRVLVVANKPVRCALTGEAEGKLPAGFDWEGATVASFGNIRGIDEWKDYACVVVIGREQLPPGAAEAAARALYCDDPDPLVLGASGYVDVPRGYRMADGSPLGVTAPVHPDGRVQALHELWREREIAQAVDRLRLVHRDDPAKVYILGSLPVDLTVDRLVELDQLVTEASVISATRKLPVLPVSPDWIAANEPALLAGPGRRADTPSTRAIETALQRVDLTARATTRVPNISSLWIMRSCSVLLYRTEPGGHRRLALGAPGILGRAKAVLSDALNKPVTELSETFMFAPPQRPDRGASAVTAETPAQRRECQPMPFYRHPLGALSNIAVRSGLIFPELAIWDRAGRGPVRWGFGLPLPAHTCPLADTG